MTVGELLDELAKRQRAERVYLQDSRDEFPVEVLQVYAGRIAQPDGDRTGVLLS